jgi:hypothetical protein
MDKIFSSYIAGTVVSLLAYTALFYLNDWLTGHWDYGLGVSWIYLPAGLRLLLTLIFGLSGAVGIAIASFFIFYLDGFSSELITIIGVALISGFAPYLARIFVMSNMKISPDLSDLNLPKLTACILIYALLSAGLHQCWFVMRGLEESGGLDHFFVMFLGDIFGAVLLIALIKFGLDLLKHSRRH